MPFDRLWRHEVQEDSEAEREAILQLREEVVRLREEEELYLRPDWQEIDALLADRQEHALRDILVGDVDQMILARERARVYRELRQLPERLRERIADLTEQIREVEGE